MTQEEPAEFQFLPSYDDGLWRGKQKEEQALLPELYKSHLLLPTYTATTSPALLALLACLLGLLLSQQPLSFSRCINRQRQPAWESQEVNHVCERGRPEAEGGGHGRRGCGSGRRQGEADRVHPGRLGRHQGAAGGEGQVRRVARRRPYSREPGACDHGLLRREREPGAVPDEGGAAEQRRRRQQRQQVDGHRLHVLPHRRLPQRLLLGTLQDLRHISGHLRLWSCAAVALDAPLPAPAGGVRHGARALRAALRHGDGHLLHRALHDRLRQRRLPAQHRHLRRRPVRRGGPHRGALQGLLLQLLLPGPQPGLPLLQHLPQLHPGQRQLGTRLLALHRRRGLSPAALPRRDATLPPLPALQQPHRKHLPGRLRRLQELEVRRVAGSGDDPLRGRREDRFLRREEASAHQRLQVLGPSSSHSHGHRRLGVHEAARPVEAVHGDAGGASEEHPADPPHLALHHPLLRRLHADGVSLRRAGRRHAQDHHARRLLRPGLQHVHVRHPHRRHHHLPLPPGHLPVPRAPHGPPGRAHRAAEDGPGPRPGRDGHGHRGNRRALQEGRRHHRQRQRPAHHLAGAAVRAHRRVGGHDVRGAARVLQRGDARRLQELRQRALHDVHVPRQLLQRRHRHRRHQGHRRPGAAGMDPRRPQRGPPQQVLLPARHTLRRRLRRVPRVRQPLQQERQGGRKERRRGELRRRAGGPDNMPRSVIGSVCLVGLAWPPGCGGS